MRRGFGGWNNMMGMGNCGTIAGPQNEVMMGWGCGPGFFNGMGNCGPMAGGFGQMPCQQGGMGNWMPQQGGPMQMPGWGRGFQRQLGPGPAQEIWGRRNGTCLAVKDQRPASGMGLVSKYLTPNHELVLAVCLPKAHSQFFTTPIAYPNPDFKCKLK